MILSPALYSFSFNLGTNMRKSGPLKPERPSQREVVSPYNVLRKLAPYDKIVSKNPLSSYVNPAIWSFALSISGTSISYVG